MANQLPSNLHKIAGVKLNTRYKGLMKCRRDKGSRQ